MRKLLLSSMLLVALPACKPCLTAYAAAPVDNSLLTEKFSVDGSTSVPGTTLQSGSYVIRVVDYLSDRSILRIEREDGKVLSTFLGIPNRSLSTEGGQGPVAWTGGSNHDKALRGYNFPGSFSVEFVYPKDEAVKIATDHSASVEAIDPSSDNLPSDQKKLSNDDMRVVTLWTLSPTRVNGTAGIAAAKYKPQEPSPAPQPEVARNEPPANPAAVASPSQSSAAAPAAPAVKPAVHRPVAKALPHTASDLPAVLLAGLLSSASLLALRTRRRFVQAQERGEVL